MNPETADVIKTLQRVRELIQVEIDKLAAENAPPVNEPPTSDARP